MPHSPLRMLQAIPVPFLHALALQEAIAQNDVARAERLAQEKTVQRYSHTQQSEVLIAALDWLAWDDYKDAARGLISTLTTSGVAFRGQYESILWPLLTHLVANNEHNIVLQLCADSLSPSGKISVFAELLRHTPSTTGALDILYARWKDVVNGRAEVQRLGWYRSKTDPRIQPPTLMEWSLLRAPDHIALALINDCARIEAEECVGLTKRDTVSDVLLDALVDKGLDLDRLMDISETSSPEMEECIAVYQQRARLYNSVQDAQVSKRVQRKL